MIPTGRPPASLLDDRRFRRFCTAEVLSQVGENALTYGLLVMVVHREEGSLYTSLLIISFLVPSLLLGLIGGVAVDSLPRRLVLVTTQVTRVAVVLAFFFSDRVLWQAYLLAAGVAAIARFHSPAVPASLPALVPADRLVAANALLSLITTASQAIGMVILAPVILKTIGEDTFLVVVAVLFAAAGQQAAMVPGLTLRRVQAGRREAGLLRSIREGFTAIRSDTRSFRAMSQLTATGAALLIVVSVVPRYARDVLNVSTENAVFLLTPGILGVVAGLRFAELLSRRIGASWVAAGGFYLFLSGVAALGFMDRIATLALGEGNLPLLGLERAFDLTPAAFFTLMVAVPAGFAYALVLASARAVLTERSPSDLRGRVFATQVTLANLASIVPLFLAGLVADRLGAQPVLVATATAGALGVPAAWVLAPRRPHPRPSVTFQ